MATGQPQTGSFSSDNPMVQQAVQDAIRARQQRGQETPALSQGSTSGAQPQPVVDASTPQAVPSNMEQQSQEVQPKPEFNELETIYKLMGQRLKQITPQGGISPTSQPSPLSPQAAPVGGGGYNWKPWY